MQKLGPEMIEMFSNGSARNKKRLASIVLRPPDLIFDQEAWIDLSGVTARLIWFGEAHIKRPATLNFAGY